MTFALQKLIVEASCELGSDACSNGRHDWHAVGGRSCPHPEDIGYSVCSQPVFECRTCGATDYGQRGGPGHYTCLTECRQKHRATDMSFWSAA